MYMLHSIVYLLFLTRKLVLKHVCLLFHAFFPSLAWKLVLKHVCLLSHALFSFPNLKLFLKNVYYALSSFLTRKLVLKHVYLLFHLFSFTHSKITSKACISLIPSSCPRLKTSFETFYCFLSLIWKLVLKHVYLLSQALFLFLTWKLVLKHIFYALSSFLTR